MVCARMHYRSPSPVAVAVSLICLLGTGCGQDRGTGDAPAEEQSGESVWSVPQEPSFRVGWDSDGLIFERIVAGFIQEDRVVVADRGANRIYVLDLSGQQIASLGGMGEGPGEFRAIAAAIPLSGDSFAVQDVNNLRVTIYAGTEHVADLPFYHGMGPASYQLLASIDAAYLLGPMGWSARDLTTGSAEWRGAPVLRTTDFVDFDSLVHVNMFTAAPGSWNPVRHGGFLLPNGEGFAHLTTERPTVRWFNTDGVELATREVDALRVAASDDHWRAYERGARERAGVETGPALEERLANRRRDFGGILPWFGRALGDDEGNIWLSPYDVARAGQDASYSAEWRVLSRSGEWMGSVEFPGEIRILHIAQGYVLGLERDEFDVEALVLYPIDLG